MTKILNDKKLSVRAPKKMYFHRGFKSIKKNTIYKEKCGIATKVKLRKFKKHNNQLYFDTLVLESYCYCGDNAKNTDFFQNTGFRSRKMAVNKISE